MLTLQTIYTFSYTEGQTMNIAYTCSHKTRFLTLTQIFPKPIQD